MAYLEDEGCLSRMTLCVTYLEDDGMANQCDGFFVTHLQHEGCLSCVTYLHDDGVAKQCDVLCDVSAG